MYPSVGNQPATFFSEDEEMEESGPVPVECPSEQLHLEPEPVKEASTNGGCSFWQETKEMG